VWNADEVLLVIYILETPINSNSVDAGEQMRLIIREEIEPLKERLKHIENNQNIC